jgi:hypothetical protein
VSVAVDHLCAEINNAADLGTEYWLLDATQSVNLDAVRAIEPKLIGRQMRIQALVLALLAIDGTVEIDSSEGLRTDLFDGLTGGSFGERDRKPDLDRASRVQASAARLNGELRSAVGRRSRKLV